MLRLGWGQHLCVRAELRAPTPTLQGEKLVERLRRVEERLHGRRIEVQAAETGAL